MYAQLVGARFDEIPANGEGDRWFGFEAVRPISGLADVLLVPLYGHTRGHCGVAVRGPENWLLHCGDAYFHNSEITSPTGGTTLGLGLFQRVNDLDTKTRRANQARLRDLARAHAGEVSLFCAHDPTELAALVALAGMPAGVAAGVPPSRSFA